MSEKVYCNKCGKELTDKDNFCSDCGEPLSKEGNKITSGSHSINTAGSAIENSTIQIGDNYNNNNIDPSILNLKRSFIKLPWSNYGKIAKRSSLFKLGTWGSIASIIGVVLPSFTSLTYMSHFFIAGLGTFMSLILLSHFLKHFRFTHFMGLMNFEAGVQDGVYLTKITCDCPWCGSGMKLRMLGSKNLKEHILLCERNPSQHRIRFDATAMPDIEE